MSRISLKPTAVASRGEQIAEATGASGRAGAHDNAVAAEKEGTSL